MAADNSKAANAGLVIAHQLIKLLWRRKNSELTPIFAPKKTELCFIAALYDAPDADGAIRIERTISQSDLGEFSGIARENVNRYIKSWSNEGLLNFNKGEITLLNMQRLRKIAEL